MKRSPLSLMTLFALLIMQPQASGVEVSRPEPATLALGAKAPDFSLAGVDDKVWGLKDFASRKCLVVVFSANHCPTAQAYEDRLIDIFHDYAPKGVGMVMISPNSPEALSLAEMGYTDVGDTLAEMEVRAEDKKFPFPYLYDGDEQKAALAYGPTATPHVFIFDADRRLRYEGRVDEKEKPGSGRAEDLRNALDAVLAGKAPAVATTKVFGCSVKWAWKDDYTKQLYKEWAALPVTLEPIDVAGVRALLTNPTGKLLLINVWATWCGPCTAEFPDLVRTDRMYRERDFEFVSISADRMEKRDKALAFLRKNEASNRNFIFSGETVYPLIEAIDPGWKGALPYTIVVGPPAPGDPRPGRSAEVHRRTPAHRPVLLIFRRHQLQPSSRTLSRSIGDARSTAARAVSMSMLVSPTKANAAGRRPVSTAMASAAAGSGL
jgi:thiol-disulfide isomerase/thioredoxin